MKDKRYIKYLSLTCLSIVLLFAVVLTASADDPRSWQFRAPMPTPRTGVTAVILDGKVYVLGGKDVDGNILNVVERYDPTTNTWDTAPMMDKERFNAAAVALNGKIYVMGGRGAGNVTLNNTEVFNPSTQQWAPLDNLLENREGLSAVVLENIIYVMGGSNESEQILNTVEYYDETGNQWRTFTSWNIQVGRASFASVSLADSAYAFGGFSSFGPLSLTQRFHVTEGVSDKASITPERGGLSAAVLEDAIYVMGGRMSNNVVIGTVNRFFPAENRWDLVEPLNEARENASAVMTQGQIFVFGGNDDQGELLSSVEAYDTVVAPFAVNDIVSTPEDSPVEVNVLQNDSDPAGGTLMIVGFTQPAQGVVTQTDTDLLTYQPNQDFSGSDLFSYTIENESGGSALATVQITVDPINDPPTFTTTPVLGALIDALYAYEISAMDVDADPLTFSSATLPAWLQLLDRGDNTAQLFGTPTETDLGQIAIELYVSDGIDSTKQAFQLTVVNEVPAAPVLLSPANGMLIDNMPVTFTWTGSDNALYQFQLATDVAFETIEVDTTLSVSTFDIDQLNADQYFWRVQASNVAGVGDWSTVFSFNLGAATNNEAEVPALNFVLAPAYPNPFQEFSLIPFEIKTSGKQVELTIFDLNGRKITTLVSRTLVAGKHQVRWDGKDAEGRALASSRYIVRLSVDNEQESQILMLIR